MADKGIIFSAPMVRALLAGRKTQTRRLCAWANNPNSPALSYIVACDESGWFGDEEGEVQFKAGYAIGDRLYVREHWKTYTAHDDRSPRDLDPEWCQPLEYLATPSPPECATLFGKHRQGMHMPRWASRLWLAVTDVRVQRLQDISEADAIAEGIVWQEPSEEDLQWAADQAVEYGCSADIEGVWTVPGMGGPGKADIWGLSPHQSYQFLWNSLHEKPGTTWADNPWIVAVSFDVNKGNIDGE